MDQRFEVVGVEDFGDSIHGVALRDRETGEVTVAFPGTDLGELSDVGRMAAIVADGTMGVTDDAEHFVKDMAAKHGPVRLTGHSAGGTLALMINDRVGEARVLRRLRWRGRLAARRANRLRLTGGMRGSAPGVAGSYL